MRLLLRFAWVTFMVACAVSIFIRTFCDEPPDGPPAIMRAAVVWSVATLVASLDYLQVRRRLNSY